MRTVPAALAARMLLTGAPIDAAEAFRVGLVSDLVPAEHLAAKVAEVADEIVANAPLSVRAVKQLLRAAQDLPLSAGLQRERDAWALLSSTQDRAEGRLAFREHRPPNFTGQ
jgi:E-phenylitaconyl-CoA hydratase